MTDIFTGSINSTFETDFNCEILESEEPLQSQSFLQISAFDGRNSVKSFSKKDSEFHKNLADAFHQVSLNCSTDDEYWQLERFYAQELSGRPDFRSVRKNSGFCEAPLHNLDRNAIARIRFKLQAIRRGTWAFRKSGKHSGSIPHSVMEVFEALAYLVLKYRRVYPSLKGLAQLATRSKQTVVNALAILEQFGVVRKIRRLKRVQTVLGTRVFQDTNAYVLSDLSGFGQIAVSLFCSASLGVQDFKITTPKQRLIWQRSESKFKAARKDIKQDSFNNQKLL